MQHCWKAQVRALRLPLNSARGQGRTREPLEAAGARAAGAPGGQRHCAGWARLAPVRVNTALHDHAAPSQLHLAMRDSLLQPNQEELSA